MNQNLQEKAKKKALWLGALAFHAKNWGSTPSTHMAVPSTGHTIHTLRHTCIHIK